MRKALIGRNLKKIKKAFLHPKLGLSENSTIGQNFSQIYIGVPSANEEDLSIYNSNKEFATWIVKKLCCYGRYNGDGAQISMIMSILGLNYHMTA